MGQKKEGWLNPVTSISVILVTSLLAVAWVLRCPASLLTASPSSFLPPFQYHVSSHRPTGRACCDIGQTCISKKDVKMTYFLE